MKQPKLFDPFQMENIIGTLYNALMSSEQCPFQDLEPFDGAGTYAIFYSGSLPLYSDLSGRDIPIYVGKAVPHGARKGDLVGEAMESSALYKRLSEHKKSLMQVQCKGMELADFSFRVLVLENFWIPMCESMLIARFAPVWNKIADGFGNHNPGSGRTKGRRSLWDTLHPGRPWAKSLPPNGMSVQAIEADIKKHLADYLAKQDKLAGKQIAASKLKSCTD